MKLVYRKSTGAVVMRADGDVVFDADTLASIDYDPTPQELENFEQNRPAFYEDGKLTFDENAADFQKREKKGREALHDVMLDRKKTVDERFEALSELIKNLDSQ